MMERGEYKPKPENAPREKTAMAEELATLRELVANLRGKLEEAVRERDQARDQLAALRAKFEADRDTALDPDQAVSQHDVVLE
jgi:predicted nuclease with TOPRIM domain